LTFGLRAWLEDPSGGRIVPTLTRETGALVYRTGIDTTPGRWGLTAYEWCGPQQAAGLPPGANELSKAGCSEGECHGTSAVRGGMQGLFKL